MKNRFSKMLCFCVLCSATALFSQSKTQLRFYGTASLPVGGFGKNLGVHPEETRRNGFDVGEGAGFAATGLGIASEFSFPAGIENADWVTGISVVMNGTDDKQLTKTFQQMLNDDSVQFDFGNWIQMPVMTGFKYMLPLGETIGVYGMIQFGIDFIFAPTRKAIVEGVTVDERKYVFEWEIGYGLGMGIDYNGEVDLGIRFFDFGKPPFDSERTLSHDYFGSAYNYTGKDIVLGQEIPVSFVTVMLGYRF
jgi:hypothetical protein